MDTKAFYKSKTFWSGIISIITGISIIIQSGHLDMTGISAILAGLGAIVGRVQATGPIGMSDSTTGNNNGKGNGSSFDPLGSKH